MVGRALDRQGVKGMLNVIDVLREHGEVVSGIEVERVPCLGYYRVFAFIDDMKGISYRVIVAQGTFASICSFSKFRRSMGRG
jgi:hypothetical protein